MFNSFKWLEINTLLVDFVSNYYSWVWYDNNVNVHIMLDAWHLLAGETKAF